MIPRVALGIPVFTLAEILEISFGSDVDAAARAFAKAYSARCTDRSSSTN